MFEYILFDLDGTLTDPKEGITKSVQFALHHLGILEPDCNKLEPFIGPPLKDSFIQYYGLDQKSTMLAIDKYRERFAKIGIFENKLYKGIPEMLASLKAEGKKLAVASSKPTIFVERILEHFSINQYFDIVVGSELDGTRSEKQEVIKEVLERFFVNKPIDYANLVMVGDRKFDIIGAKELGIVSIGVTYGYAIGNELQEAGADYIAGSVEKLKKLLLKKEKKPGGRIPLQEEEEKKKTAYKTKPVDSNQQESTEGKKKILWKLFQIIYPFLLYYFIYQIAVILLAVIIQKISIFLGFENWLIGNVDKLSPVISGMAMLIGSSFLFSSFLREMKSGYFPYAEKKMDSFKRFLYVEISTQKKYKRYYIPTIMLGIMASYFFSTLFALLHITSLSQSFADVSQRQLSVPLWLALILYGVISPLAEEIVFRGVIYNRLKKVFPPIWAALSGAIIFGLYHGNLVQGIYGFFMGLAIIYAYEIHKSFLAPLLIHSIANVAVVLAAYFSTVTVSWNAPQNCALFGVYAIVCITIMKKMKIK